ncbi:MAG: hypothetical protein O3B13_10395 [Planctomycetota bacterium]|nr:hypothetical protein [Planctomycetota bacterium]
MRQRHDFYTLCPGCETKVELTLAAKLQAARAGCSCVCHACQHEWVSIQEWIYRRESVDLSQPIMTPEQPAALPHEYRSHMQTPSAPAVTAMQPPRPHLPTFQPPQPISQPPQQQVAASENSNLLSSDQPVVNPVPAPHAWSWERKTQQQPVQNRDLQNGYDH